MPIIERLTASEILDSRGRPTVKAGCLLAGGAAASASVPSGVSTGTAEALELRDRDPRRYGGFGCRKAVAQVSGEIHGALAGRAFADQSELDSALAELDGTPNKSRLGANAILAVSVAFARACAQERGLPLYQYFAAILGHSPDTLPRLTINLFSGGKHAGRQVAIQDVLMVPARPATIDDSLAMAYDVYQAAAALILKRYSMRLLTADEGGLAPQCESTEELIEMAVVAIKAAGYKPGVDVMLALDVAASHFYDNHHAPAGTGEARAGRGRRLTLHEPGSHPARHCGAGLQYAAAEAQPDRYPDGSRRSLATGEGRGMAGNGQRAQRRDGG
jgi:enolase